MSDPVAFYGWPGVWWLGLGLAPRVVGGGCEGGSVGCTGPLGWGFLVGDGDSVEGFGVFSGNGEGVVDVSAGGLGGEAVEADLGASCFDGGVVGSGGVCAGG